MNEDRWSASNPFDLAPDEGEQMCEECGDTGACDYRFVTTVTRKTTTESLCDACARRSGRRAG